MTNTGISTTGDIVASLGDVASNTGNIATDLIVGDTVTSNVVEAFSFVTLSDESLKEDIKDLEDESLDKINKIKLRTFRFIEDAKTKKTSIEIESRCGVIAQELEEIIPEAVKTTKLHKKEEITEEVVVEDKNVDNGIKTIVEMSGDEEIKTIVEIRDSKDVVDEKVEVEEKEIKYYLGVDYDVLLIHTIKALQELTLEVQKLKQKK